MSEYDYDTLIIGAGMSGLGAAIRLAMFDKKVLLVEKHTIAGGLNSFYAQKGHLLDVGLHALTNFASQGDRRKPLIKILKQLRLKYADLKLDEQTYSKVCYPNKVFKFSNDIKVLLQEVETHFPGEYHNFNEFLNFVEYFNETALDLKYESAREKLQTFFKDDLFIDMLICPLLIYGSAWERDMDFAQFVIMFKAIYLEGFSRPQGGVRTLIRLLLNRYKELKGEVRYRTKVTKIQSFADHVKVTLENGELLKVKQVLSSIGAPETYRLTEHEFSYSSPRPGKMTFTESILFFNKKPQDFGIDETIVFYNDNPTYEYRQPDDLFDDKSAVICFPNSFHNEREKEEFQHGIIRLTFMANYQKWKELKEINQEKYLEEKENVLKSSLALIKKLYPQFQAELVFSDVFTPTTIEKFTGHLNGCVYGSVDKFRDGKTEIPNVYLCGTDQGFLGIVGALLSGISIANLYGLQND